MRPSAFSRERAKSETKRSLRQQKNSTIEKMSTFPEKLASLMKERRYNKSTLGKALGVTHSTVARWLNGSLPNGETATHLARILNVSAQWLFSDIGAQTIPDAAGIYQAGTPRAGPDARAATVLRDSLSAHKARAATTEQRRGDLVALVEQRLAEMDAAGPAQTETILEELAAALRAHARWIAAVREDSTAVTPADPGQTRRKPHDR